MHDTILRNFDAIRQRIIDAGAGLNTDQIVAELNDQLRNLDDYEASQLLGLRVEALCTRYNYLDELHEKYDRLVWSAIWKALHNQAGMMPFYKQEVKDDLNSMCWAHIIQNIDKYKETPKGSLRGWIFTVARNFVTDWKGKRAVQLKKHTDVQMHDACICANPRTRVSKLLTPSNTGWRGRKWAHCPECNEVKLITASLRGGFVLKCGHERGRAL